MIVLQTAAVTSVVDRKQFRKQVGILDLPGHHIKLETVDTEINPYIEQIANILTVDADQISYDPKLVIELPREGNYLPYDLTSCKIADPKISDLEELQWFHQCLLEYDTSLIIFRFTNKIFYVGETRALMRATNRFDTSYPGFICVEVKKEKDAVSNALALKFVIRSLLYSGKNAIPRNGVDNSKVKLKKLKPESLELYQVYSRFNRDFEQVRLREEERLTVSKFDGLDEFPDINNGVHDVQSDLRIRTEILECIGLILLCEENKTLIKKLKLDGKTLKDSEVTGNKALEERLKFLSSKLGNSEQVLKYLRNCGFTDPLISLLGNSQEVLDKSNVPLALNRYLFPLSDFMTNLLKLDDAHNVPVIGGKPLDPVTLRDFFNLEKTRKKVTEYYVVKCEGVPYLSDGLRTDKVSSNYYQSLDRIKAEAITIAKGEIVFEVINNDGKTNRQDRYAISQRRTERKKRNWGDVIMTKIMEDYEPTPETEKWGRKKIGKPDSQYWTGEPVKFSSRVAEVNPSLAVSLVDQEAC